LFEFAFLPLRGFRGIIFAGEFGFQLFDLALGVLQVGQKFMFIVFGFRHLHFLLDLSVSKIGQLLFDLAPLLLDFFICSSRVEFYELAQLQKLLL
jgi:hypothetical protein